MAKQQSWQPLAAENLEEIGKRFIALSGTAQKRKPQAFPVELMYCRQCLDEAPPHLFPQCG